MIIWQVNWNSDDSNHKLFVLARDAKTDGKSKKSSYITSWNGAIGRRGGGAYYFYMEFVK